MVKQYKVGDKIRVIANKTKNKNYPLRYYHGGDIKAVPIGTCGVIQRIEYSKSVSMVLPLKLKVATSWLLHPTEIALIETKLHKLKKQLLGEK